jgi:DNA-binding HxlR family transcriptional regulator
MRTYGQYCPIARASEILAERWTPIIMRNVLHGGTTFTEIAQGAPGISRTLLTTRLRELERAGVIETRPNPAGRGRLYLPTPAGRDLADVMAALGTWGERWIELAPEHLDPGMVLHSWVTWYLERGRLPERRVVVRFDMTGLPGRAKRLWIIFDAEQSEVCLRDPGFEEDLFVEAEPRALAEWHLGRVEWVDAVRDDRIRVIGPAALARALPSWNQRSEAARARVRRGASARGGFSGSPRSALGAFGPARSRETSAP